GLLCWFITLHPVLQGLEEWCQDAWFVYRGPRRSATKVILVGLDEASLERLPKPLAFLSPELARVVTYLRSHGARVIGLDLMVPQSLDAYPGLQGEELGLAAESGGIVMPAILKDGGNLLRPLRTWQTGVPLGLANLDEDNDHFLRRQSLYGRVGGEDHD